jgi:ADP-ribose pyrophosphatase YjhB (NUDIX family)
MSGEEEKPGRGVGRWEILESAWAFRSRLLGLRVDRCRLPDGRLSPDFYFMALPDACVTVALTTDGDVLLAREYKHGAGDVVFTLPAGFVEPGEAPEAAARRELREETGYTGARFERLGSFLVLPGLSGMTVHAFLVVGAIRTSETRFDEYEQIDVVAVPLEAARRDLRGGKGRYFGDVSSSLALALALDRLADGGPAPDGPSRTPEAQEPPAL